MITAEMMFDDLMSVINTEYQSNWNRRHRLQPPSVRWCVALSLEQLAPLSRILWRWPR